VGATLLPRCAWPQGATAAAPARPPGSTTAVEAASPALRRALRRLWREAAVAPQLLAAVDGATEDDDRSRPGSAAASALESSDLTECRRGRLVPPPPLPLAVLFSVGPLQLSCTAHLGSSSPPPPPPQAPLLLVVRSPPASAAAPPPGSIRRAAKSASVSTTPLKVASFCSQLN
jgi:hypothetical protein